MKTETRILLEKIHDGILNKHKGHVMLLEIIFVAGDFIQYYINNGIIGESERQECYYYIANKVYYKYNCTMSGAIEGWVLLMEDRKDNNDVISRSINLYKTYVDRA